METKKANVNFYKEGSRLIIVIDGIEDEMTRHWVLLLIQW